MIGNWKLTTFDTTDVSASNLSATWSQDRFSIHLCNSISGNYAMNGNAFTTSNVISTMMYCSGLPMTLENAWNLDGATYTLVALRRMAGSVGPSMQMTITTK